MPIISCAGKSKSTSNVLGDCHCLIIAVERLGDDVTQKFDARGTVASTCAVSLDCLASTVDCDDASTKTGGAECSVLLAQDGLEFIENIGVII